MKIIQQAKWVSTPQAWTDRNANPVQTIEQPAIIQIDGICLYSAMPKSAAEALKINESLEHVVGITA